MHTKVLTLSTLLAVASASLNINAMQARDVGNVLQKRQLGGSCTLGADASSLIDSLPTAPADITSDLCNPTALASLASSPEFTSYLNAVLSWESVHSDALTSLESSILTACTENSSVLSSLSESLANNPTGGNSCATTTDGSGSGVTTGSSPSSTGGAVSPNTASTSPSSSGVTKSTSSASKSTTGSSSTQTGSAAQQTFAAYAGAAIIGAMGVIAAL
jgi:hypothetical protein